MKISKTFVSINVLGYWIFERKTGVSRKAYETKEDRLKYPAITNKKIGDLMIIYERIFELTENEMKYGGFTDYIINELIDE